MKLILKWGVWPIAGLMFLLAATGVIKGEEDAQRFAEIQQVKDEAEFDRRLQAELLAANDLDMAKAHAKYIGKASRHNEGSRATINSVNRDLMEQGLYEVK